MLVKLGRFTLIGISVSIVLFGAAPLSTTRAENFAGDVPDLVWLDAGWSRNDISTSVAFLGENGLGATIDFEEIFDMNANRSTARMFGTARISEKRRHIDFGYVDIRRSGTNVLDRDIEFGDYQINAGGSVTAKFDSAFIYAAFRYDCLHLEQVRISGRAGLTWLNLSTGLTGSGNYTDPDGTQVVGSFEKESSVGAPVPMIGINLDWALTRRLVLRTYSRLFRINLDSFSGGLN